MAGLLLVGCVSYGHDDKPKPRPPQCEEELLFCEGGCPDLPARVEDVRLDRADSRPNDEQPQYAVYTCDDYHVVARVKWTGPTTTTSMAASSSRFAKRELTPRAAT